MQKIHVARYSHPGHGYVGWIEPEDRSWLLFVAADGPPVLMLPVDQTDAEGKTERGFMEAHALLDANDKEIPEETLYHLGLRTRDFKRDADVIEAWEGRRHPEGKTLTAQDLQKMADPTFPLSAG